MHKITIILVLLILSPFVILCVHALVSRTLLFLKPGFSNQLACILSVVAGHIPMGLLLWFFAFNPTALSNELVAPSVIYCLIVYNAIGYCYFHLFNMSETARRIRILYEVKKAGRLEDSEIQSMYDTGNMFTVRVERLLSMNQIREEGGRYRLSGYFLYIPALIINFWGNLINLPLLKDPEKKV